MVIDDFFHGISTLIQVSAQDYESTGSGFFYEDFKDGSEKAEKIWLVTNRHVLLSKIAGKEFVPDSLTFNLRKRNTSGSLIWNPVTLTKTELLDRSLFHSDPKVDVGIVEIKDKLDEQKTEQSNFNWHAVSKKYFPENDDSTVDVAEDIVAIGYPRGHYDHANVFPIVKSGTIATRFGNFFNGRPYFLIDAHLFPGSSGSIVLTKPREYEIKDGSLIPLESKKFKFLGVFSGEPFFRQDPIESDDMTIILKARFNVGIVWYGSLIEEIIKNGTHLT